MRGDMLLMKALPFAVLSASLAMVACDGIAGKSGWRRF